MHPAGVSFLSTLTHLAKYAATKKPKHKHDYIAALANFFSKGKGPNGNPMSDDQVRRVFAVSQIGWKA